MLHQQQDQHCSFLPVLAVFCMSRQWCGCQGLGFLMCTQVLMHVIAQGGCVNTIRESALTVDSGRKIPCCTGELGLCQYCAWLFSLTLCQLSYPASVCVHLPLTSQSVHVLVSQCLGRLGVGIALWFFLFGFWF